jgi:hypothetical protein
MLYRAGSCVIEKHATLAVEPTRLQVMYSLGQSERSEGGREGGVVAKPDTVPYELGSTRSIGTMWQDELRDLQPEQALEMRG